MENKIKDFLPNVFGYDTIKKQLKEVYDQYMDRLKMERISPIYPKDLFSMESLEMVKL